MALFPALQWEIAVEILSTLSLPSEADVLAPDGSEVRLLCQTRLGSMAHFTLPPGAVSRAVAHRTVEEIWLFLGGRGRMWRRLDGQEQTVEVAQGVSLTIPVGARFQFRNDGDTPLEAVATTMPPWPGEAEASFVEGIWPATVRMDD